MQSIQLLVVEDEALIRELLDHVLSDAGFEVTSASDGAQAFAELESKASQFRAVITDIRLGRGPDGWAVAHRARELAPEVAIIYVSGDSAHDWSASGVPNSVMITKPFVPAQILTAVATLLNKTDGD